MDRAWAHCLAYNEALMIPYWVRHYKTFCERVIVYVDQDTTDGTAEFVRANGGEARVYEGSGYLDDLAFVEIAECEYRKARGKADWVIWTDADEFVYSHDMAGRLDLLRDGGVTLPNIAGFCMIAPEPPRGHGQIYDEIRAGFPSTEYSKICLLSPWLNVRWQPGKHTAEFEGERPNRDSSNDPIKLLHYRWLGEEYFRERNRRNYERIDETNRKRGHGVETYPGWNGKYSVEWFKTQLDAAMPVV